MIKYFSIPDFPGIVVRKVDSVSLDQLDLPPNSVYLYYDATEKALMLWDGTNLIKLTTMIQTDEEFAFFCYAADLPFAGDIFV